MTDERDDLCITALLNKYFHRDVMNVDYDFAPGGEYISPKDLSIDAIKDMVCNCRKKMIRRYLASTQIPI